MPCITTVYRRDKDTMGMVAGEKKYVLDHIKICTREMPECKHGCYIGLTLF